MVNTNPNSDFKFNFNMDNSIPKISTISGKIHINNNWSTAKAAGFCTGNGTYSDPYVIEDLIIDGGSSGSCIFIENSNVYFTIENCSVYNSSGSHNAGIELSKTNNGNLTNNNCTNNDRGIFIDHSHNNTISGNSVNNNFHGIELFWSNNNTISENTANNNAAFGVCLNGGSYDNIISENIMYKCGLLVGGSYEMKASLIIDTTNLVNGKLLYYYLNEINLGPNNFTNAGQIILVNCNNSLISNLNTSNCSRGITLYYCNNNTVSGNIANYNSYGILLVESHNNTVSGNTVNICYYAIYLLVSSYNTVSGNTAINNTIGTYLYFSDDNTVTGNTAINNSLGMYLFDSDYVIISENAVNNNSMGIQLYFYSEYNTVSGNNINCNVKYGIYLNHVYYNTISGNIANSNSIGIKLSNGGRNNIISGNILLGNEICIYEDETSGPNVFENNDCGERGNNGIPFELIIFISIISGAAAIITASVLLYKHRRKRI